MERCFKVMRGGHGQQVQPANSVLAQLNDDPIEDWDAELGLEPPTIYKVRVMKHGAMDCGELQMEDGSTTTMRTYGWWR
jgi:hypothetical protein